MTPRAVILAGIFLLGTSWPGSAQLVTEQEVQNKLEQAGYTRIHDIKFGSEGINAKAMKDGKEWSLVVDSSGKILQQEAK
jgi:hypothetical protein